MGKLPAWFVAGGAAIALAACGGRPVVVDPPPPTVEEFEIIDGSVGDDASATGLEDDGVTIIEPDPAPQQPEPVDDFLGMRVVYFAYDSSILDAEGEAVVRAHAQYLLGASNVQIILEGHADERGTREYNLALAEDRARSVANLMQAAGVASGRIQTVSYGEERPVALGHDESAWSLNRRVEILYQ